MRTIGGHNPCLIISDGLAPEADAIVFSGSPPKDTRLLVQDVGDDEIFAVADMLLLREGEITNRPLIERCALSGIPTLLCTQGSSLKEISRAVGWHQLAFRNGAEQSPARQRVSIGGGGRLVLLHGGENLRAMARIHEQTLMPVGYEGHESEALAVAAGACVLLRRVDEQFAGAVKAVREAEALLGEPRTATAPDANRKRRAVVAARALSKGQKLSPDDVSLRAPVPENGAIEPWQLEDMLGRTLTCDVEEGAAIVESMLDGKSPEPPPWFSPRPPRDKPT